MKHKLLFDTNPLIIIPELAVAIGLNESIVLQQIHYWLRINEKAGRNFRDGRHWTYNSVAAWTEENFPWWGEHTVRRALTSLREPNEERGPLLITANYNKMSSDRTLWYTIDYDEFDRLMGGMGKSCVQNGQMDVSKVDQPLPETISETNDKQDPSPSRSAAEPTFTGGIPKRTHPSPQVKGRGKKKSSLGGKKKPKEKTSDVVTVPEASPPLCPKCGVPEEHWRRLSTGKEWYNHKLASGGFCESYPIEALRPVKGRVKKLIFDPYGTNDRVEWVTPENPDAAS